MWAERKRCLAGVLGALLVLALSSSVYAERWVNLLPNPGLERGMPDPWYVYLSGQMTLNRSKQEAHSGEFYVTLRWKPHVEGGYSALCNPHPDLYGNMEVQPGTPYTVGVWARGKGTVALWIFQTSKSGKFIGTDFGKDEKLTDTWKHYERAWRPAEGVCNGTLALRITGVYADFDDATVSFDSEAHPLPERETIKISHRLMASESTVEFYVNGEKVAADTVVPYGEYVLAVKAGAAGDGPLVSGMASVGDFEVPMDERWRVAPVPADDAWKKPGFDDTKWAFASGRDGVWAPDGGKEIALRRVVLWKKERVSPWRKNQWVTMMRDRMFLPRGGMQTWVSIIDPPTAAPCSEVVLRLEVPDFLRLLDKREEGTNYYSNWWPSKVEVEPFARDGARYNHYRIRYAVPAPGSRFRAWAPLYFGIDDQVPAPPKGKEYVWRYWREANGNITDVPTTLPIIVTGPVSGRQCKYFQLVYNRPGIMHTGGWGTYSLSQRKAIADTLISCGMNVAYLGSLSNRNKVRDSFLYLQDKGVKFYSRSFNGGMTVYPNYAGIAFLKEYPEFAGRTYKGDPKKFKDAFHEPAPPPDAQYAIWCQEYVAQGGKEFYDRMRPGLEEERKLFPSVKYWMWDWEGRPYTSSSFADRDIKSFRAFAKIPDDLKLTDEIIAEKYGGEWTRFRVDQTARHIRSMIKFLKEYGIELTVWMPGGGWKQHGLDLSLVKDVYAYHFMGWPGSDLPLFGAGQGGSPASGWRKIFGNVHLVAQSIVNIFPVQVIDERMFKIWTMDACLGTAGGGWTLWMDCMFPFGQTGGMSYFIGEATRMIDAYQETFRRANHVTGKFTQEGLKGRGSGLVALEGPDGNSILVLVFNHSGEPAELTVTSGAVPGWTVKQWEGKAFADSKNVKLTVRAYDVIALDYRRE